MTGPVNTHGGDRLPTSEEDKPLTPGGGKPRHSAFARMGSYSRLANWPVLQFVVIGSVLELLYLLVFALSPLSTAIKRVSPMASAWPWTLALTQLLFHRSWSSSGGYADSGLYFLLLGLTFIALSSVYLYAVRRVFHTTSKIHITSRWLILPLLGATIFGVTLLFLPALFSNEVYSYIFSGRLLTIYHVDPMNAAPAQFQQDPYLAWISQPNAPNIYGPLWMIIASLLAGMGNSPVATLLLFKGLVLLTHLVNCLLIWVILGKLAPERRLLGTFLYAWNPLALIELAGNGHHDSMLICLLLLATWLSVQQKGGWYDAGTVALLGLASSINLIGLLFVPLFIWFSVRNERDIAHAIWGFCWRAILVLATLFIVYLPFWHGSSTFIAITSSINILYFYYSPLSVLALPMRWLFSLIALAAHFPPSYMQPTTAADVTVQASGMFIFALIYLYLLARVRRASARQGFNVLLTSLSIAVSAYVVLVLGSFWPWYVLWILWVVALHRYDALTVSVLLLSCTALLAYPLLYVDALPIAVYQPLLIFGVPLVYLIAQMKPFVGARFIAPRGGVEGERAKPDHYKPVLPKNVDPK
jgi:hypothetical protein